LPAPTEVFSAGWELIGTGELREHISISLWRAIVGFLIGGILGFFLGLFNGLFKISDLLFDTSIQMLRNIPHLALIPLVILWFGIDETSKIFLVALGVLFPVYINTYHGIKSVDKDLIEMGRAYGLKGPALFFTVIFPGALSSILVGVRFSLVAAGFSKFQGSGILIPKNSDLNCCRNHLRPFGNWIHGNECTRVYANGCDCPEHRSLCFIR
jgi:sulfonate transport system permease protein